LQWGFEANLNGHVHGTSFTLFAQYRDQCHGAKESISHVAKTWMNM
jgi:hypothetical protein